LREFGPADVIFAPYLERMNASLFYYKGYDLRKEHPTIGKWFDAMETRSCYRGTQSDFMTHAYALPLFLGEC
jgi:glutathione S-transferase